MKRLIGKRLVIIESPYAGNVEQNIEYARKCLLDSLRRGEAPFASHLLYPHQHVLNDAALDEREEGMQAGFAWGDIADARVVYADHGISPGMARAIHRSRTLGQLVEYRKILGAEVAA